MKVYTGIGSRETPGHVLPLMKSIAAELSCRGWTLRSGCAPGADSAFEEGAWIARDTNGRRPRPELYLPWPRFEGRRSILTELDEPQDTAYSIAAQHHPRWASLTNGARSLHARNVHQILGRDVSNPVPSRFVICWTPDGAGGGGTGQAIRIAQAFGVPVYDLAIDTDAQRVLRLFGSV